MSARRTVAHAGWETRLVLRNGEQLLLTFLIPIGLLLGLTLTRLGGTLGGDGSVARALATVLAVSVISSAFTSLAIATGFERRSGALRFLATTPLSRMDLLGGKAGSTAIVTGLSAGLAAVVALALGWRPGGASTWALPLIVLGTAAFAAWGFTLAGLLRAEAVLAVANGLFLVLIMFGGVIIPTASLPAPMGAIVQWLPSSALAEGLRACLVAGSAPSAQTWLVLVAWLTVGLGIARRTFRWT